MVVLEFYHKIWLGVIECLVIHQGGVIYIGAQLEFHPSHKILNAAIMSHAKILSHKKEQNCAICRDMDGPRDCHTQWSKSEREKQIPYINTQMWNVGKQYSWTYLQSRNRDIHREPVYGHQGGEKRWDELGDWDWHIYIYILHLCMLSLFNCVQLFAILWTVACQALLSMAFSRQKYWSGLPCPPPGDLTDPWSNPHYVWLLYCRQIPFHWATREAHINTSVSEVGK